MRCIGHTLLSRWQQCGEAPGKCHLGQGEEARRPLSRPAQKMASNGQQHGANRRRSTCTKDAVRAFKSMRFEDLKNWMYCEEAFVASQFGVSRSFFKKQCRKIGIMKWPCKKVSIHTHFDIGRMKEELKESQGTALLCEIHCS